MCGIAGIIDRDGVPERDALERARDTLTHRGPDDAGLFVNRRRDAALLFRRLAVIDLTPAAAQPFASDDGIRHVVFNGEIYNFRELRRTLEHAGHRFRSQSDTEVLLHAYEEWGSACLDRLVGMFAFAIWDDQARTLFAARDRLGIKPLYYQQSGHTLRFASELKPLLSLPGVNARIDEGSLCEYLSRGYISAPGSILAGIRSLSPAHRLQWVADTGRLTIERYWDPLDAYRLGASTGSRFGETADVVEELDALIRAAVALRLNSDVPFGAFLSGGLDSTLIVAMMAATSRETIQTFTVGFPGSPDDESAAAAAVAKHLGTEHHTLHASEAQALEFIPRLSDYFDEPFADSSAISTYLVSLMARQRVTVALSGDGGDELFGGYLHYRTILGRLGYARAIPDAVRKLLRPLADALPESRAQAALGALTSVACAEGFFDYFTSLWRPTELRRLAPGLMPAQGRPASRITHEGASDLDVFMLSDLQRYLPHDILTKVDRASMAVSLEARVPLLDHRVVEYVVGLHHSFKVNGATQKVLLRRVLAKYVPATLTDRPKKGFTIPLDQWLRGPLKWMLDEYLSPSRLGPAGLFDPHAVRRVVSRFMRGEIGHARPWALIVYQLWAEKYRFG